MRILYLSLLFEIVIFLAALETGELHRIHYEHLHGTNKLNLDPFDSSSEEDSGEVDMNTLRQFDTGL